MKVEKLFVNNQKNILKFLKEYFYVSGFASEQYKKLKNCNFAEEIRL